MTHSTSGEKQVTRGGNMTFVKAGLQHKDIVFEWLDKSHVKEFWDNSPEHAQDILSFMKGRQEDSQYYNGIFDYWVGFFEGVPYCLCMTSEVVVDSDIPEAWVPHISQTGKTFSIDFMIGNEAYLGKGFAAPTLKEFTQFICQEVEPDVDTFIIDPAENNPRAKHVYATAGFEIVDEFTREKGHFQGLKHFLMVKRIYPAPVLVPATLDDYSKIQNMARFYVYDMSRFCGWECPEDGLYECFDSKQYFMEEDRHPFLVRVGEELAGFVMINTYGTSEDVDWNVAQFFILAKFQGKGTGEQVAFKVFDKYKGVWECSVIPQNVGAIRFWQKTIETYTNGNFAKGNFTKKIKTVTYPRVVWRFESN